MPETRDPGYEAMAARIAELEAELESARERESAIAGVLHALGSTSESPDDVFEALLTNALRLLGGTNATLHLLGPDGRSQLAAGTGLTPEWRALQVQYSGWTVDRARNGPTSSVMRRDSEVGKLQAGPWGSVPYDAASAGLVPLVHGGQVIGALQVLRGDSDQEFRASELALLENFAAQAVIAIEQARLVRDLAQSNREVADALEQQTAVADVLRIVASSPSDLDAILHGIARETERLCQAEHVSVSYHTSDGELRWWDSVRGIQHFEDREAALAAYSQGGRTFASAVLDSGQPLRVCGPIESWENEYPGAAVLNRQDGLTELAALCVPLPGPDGPLGGLLAIRRRAVPFEDSDVETLKTFADQALIAIENARLFNEQQEALDRQTAMAEVLDIISRSATDAQPVLDAIVAKAARLTGAADANIFFRDGEVAREAARFDPTGVIAGAPAEVPVLETSIVGKALLESTVQHLSGDFAAWSEKFPYEAPLLQELGHEHFTGLAVPLDRGGETIGCLTMDRPGIRPFSNEEIALIEAFADQAVIAIENARLFNELQERNREVSEALERQTALASVLQTISRSVFDLDAVLHRLITEAGDLVGSTSSTIWMIEGDELVARATAPVTTEEARLLAGGRVPLTTSGALSTAIADRRRMETVLHPDIPGIMAAPGTLGEYFRRFLRGPQSIMVVPLLRPDGPVGVFAVGRHGDQPFDERQIALIETFADQAVIAIENARLFNKLQEALERQTAIAAILGAMAGSPGDVDGTLQEISSIAARLCQADEGVIYHVFNGEQRGYGPTGVTGLPNDVTGTFVGAAMQANRPVHVVGPIEEWEDTYPQAAARNRAQGRTEVAALAVPIPGAQGPVGGLLVFRTTAVAFEERHTEILQTFADQAVIAIENARLFNELQERNRDLNEAFERQGATAEVMAVVGASAADSQPVFDAIVQRSLSLFSAHVAFVALRKDDQFVIAAFGGASAGPVVDSVVGEAGPLFGEHYIGNPILTGKEFAFSGTIDEFRQAFSQDALTFQLWEQLSPEHGAGAVFVAPLIHDGVTIGALGALRTAEHTPPAFSTEETSLVRTFADQAVIAIENARLFNELQERNREVSEALERQTAMAEVLQAISRSAFDVQSVLDTLLEQAARLLKARFASIGIVEDGYIVERSVYPRGDPEAEEHRGRRREMDASVGRVRAIRDRRTIAGTYRPDSQANRAMSDESFADHQRLGMQSRLFAPLLGSGRAVGAITLIVPGERIWTEPEKTLLQTFADQAVIAIENARLFNELEERNREVTEALEVQTAMAEVLEIIGRSTQDEKPVLMEIARKAARLLGAQAANFMQVQGSAISYTATYFEPGTEWTRVPVDLVGPVRYEVGDPLNPYGRAVETHQRQTYVVRPGVSYPQDWNPTARRLIEVIMHEVGVASGATVPLLKDGQAIGVIEVATTGEREYSERDIRLLQTFADQAVIAIENARLFNELEERNREVSEALERQTAVAGVLQTISRSAFDLDVVLNELAEQANSLVEGDVTSVAQMKGGFLRYTHTYPRDTPEAEFVSQLVTPAEAEVPALLALRARRSLFGILHADDDLVATMPDDARAYLERFGTTSAALLPMSTGDRSLGLLEVRKHGERQFSEDEKALLETFADQAVIAIENARLFNELQERNREVSEALEQQTATAEVMAVVGSSASDARPVFQAIVERVGPLFQADTAGVYLRQGDLLHPQALYSRIVSVTELADVATEPVGPSVDVFHTGEPSWFFGSVEDYANAYPLDAHMIDAWRSSYPDNMGATLTYPLRVGGAVAGLLWLVRKDHAFDDADLAVVKTFTDQAVIAIENARLFNELEERNREVSDALAQQTAVSSVLQTISRSAFDLDAVLKTLVEQAALLTGARADITLVEGDVLRPRAFFPADTDSARTMATMTYPLDSQTPRALTIQRGRRVMTTIQPNDPRLALSTDDDRQFAERFITHPISQMFVPLIGGVGPIGAFGIAIDGEHRFTEREISLLETFADQAVIAIENARLFNELQERNREITEALHREEATSEILGLISSAPEDLDRTLQALTNACTRLTGMGSVVSLPEGGDLVVRGQTLAPGDAMNNAVGLRSSTNESMSVGLAFRTGQPVILNASDLDTAARERAAAMGLRAMAAVPIMQGDAALGVLTVGNSSGAEITRETVALIESFADQAAIAIENARLLRELRERNREVTEALHREEATSEILGLISSAPEDLDRTLQALTNACTRLTGMGSTVSLPEGEDLVVRGQSLAPGDGMANVLGYRSSIAGSMSIGLAFRTGKPVVLRGLDSDPHARERLAAMQIRALAAVPILQGDTALGVLSVGNSSGAEITDEAVALLESFADQAAIAIENARLLRELRERTAELEVASRHKSEFLANMSHELRTPLNAIIGYSELLQEEAADLGDDDYVPDLKKIHTAGRHLLTLISGILDLSKIEAGRMTMYLEDFDIATLVNDTRDIIQPLVERNRNRLEVECPEGIGAMHADLVKLRQVLFNLLSNAAKFTEDGLVSLRVTREGESVRFAISDTGIGITEEQRARLFEAFSQADAAVSQKYGGTGLGLALSRSFCQMMGGDIELESEYGEGSTFTVTIPAHVRELPETEAAGRS